MLTETIGKMGSKLSSQKPGRYTIASVCVLGEGGIGKKSLTRRFMKDQFTDDDPGADDEVLDYRFQLRKVELNGNDIELRIRTYTMDCDKQSEFWQTSRYYGGILLVYSVTDKYSFERLSWWIDEVKTHCEGDIPIVLVGNKCDEVSKTVVDFPTAWDFATEKNLPLVEVSAKDGTNVELAFITLLSKMTLDHIYCRTTVRYY